MSQSLRYPNLPQNLDLTSVSSISGTWRSKVGKIFFFKASMAKTQIPTGAHILNSIFLKITLHNFREKSSCSVLWESQTPSFTIFFSNLKTFHQHLRNLCRMNFLCWQNLGKFAQIFPWDVGSIDNSQMFPNRPSNWKRWLTENKYYICSSLRIIEINSVLRWVPWAEIAWAS